MNQTHDIDVYGKASELICAGCSHGSEGSADGACSSCAPGAKRATLALVDEFRSLLEASELADRYRVSFFESTPENLARNADVQRLLSMASLEPVICIGGKIAYLGGFSPEGLLAELRKR